MTGDGIRLKDGGVITQACTASSTSNIFKNFNQLLDRANNVSDKKRMALLCILLVENNLCKFKPAPLAGVTGDFVLGLCNINYPYRVNNIICVVLFKETIKLGIVDLDLLLDANKFTQNMPSL